MTGTSSRNNSVKLEQESAKMNNDVESAPVVSNSAAPKGIMRKRSNTNVVPASDDSSSGFPSSTGNNERSEDNTSGGASGTGHTSAGGQTGSGGGSTMLFSSKSHVFQFLKDETRSVLYSQRFVYFVIVAAAAALSTLTYLVIKQDQESDFETQVSLFGNAKVHCFGTKLTNTSPTTIHTMALPVTVALCCMT